jgi:hypothetical protein
MADEILKFFLIKE